jgi:hypothetical protein
MGHGKWAMGNGKLFCPAHTGSEYVLVELFITLVFLVQPTNTASRPNATLSGQVRHIAFEWRRFLAPTPSWVRQQLFFLSGAGLVDQQGKATFILG